MDDSNTTDEVRSAGALVLVEIVEVSDGMDAVDRSVLCVTEVSLYCVVRGDKDVRVVEVISVDTSAAVEVRMTAVVASVEMAADEGKLEDSVDLVSVTEDVSARDVVSSIMFVESVEEGELIVDKVELTILSVVTL